MKGILQAGQHLHYQSHISKLKVEEPLLVKTSFHNPNLVHKGKWISSVIHLSSREKVAGRLSLEGDSSTNSVETKFQAVSSCHPNATCFPSQNEHFTTQRRGNVSLCSHSSPKL
jgi:hypothetical protein